MAASAPSVADAQAAILEHLTRQPTLRLPLIDALGHRLSHDTIAPWPLPMWTAASMDGFAVRADDVRGASPATPRVLPLAGGGDAGEGEPPPLEPGTAWRVATGGRVPVSADSVIRQEDTQREARGETQEASVTFVNDRDALRNVRPAGGDVAAGTTILPAGTLVTPAVVAMLAALGEASPMVFRRPRVVILCSGNEVASLDEVDRIAAGERIADVNGPMLGALVREAGGVPVLLGLVADDPAAIADAIRGATDADLVISAGGISVGVQDHIVHVMESLRARMLFRRVRLRPGGPTTHALLPGGLPWLALPGNPVSAFVTFHLFAAPAIRAMAGAESPLTPHHRAVLGTVVARDPNLDQYIRVTLRPAASSGGGLPLANPTGNQGSWVLSSIVSADGLAVVEAGEGQVPDGSEVSVLLVNGEW